MGSELPGEGSRICKFHLRGFLSYLQKQSQVIGSMHRDRPQDVAHQHAAYYKKLKEHITPFSLYKIYCLRMEHAHVPDLTSIRNISHCSNSNICCLGMEHSYTCS